MTANDQAKYGARAASGESPRRIRLGLLAGWSEQLLGAAGLSEDAASLVAESLVDAEARGVSSHGIARNRIYVERLRRGLIDATAQPSVERSTPASVHVDARNAIGHVGCAFGVDEARTRAEQLGVGVAVIKNSNHCGTLGFFARRVTAGGQIAIIASNGPPVMVYHGGRTRAVGTNPLAIAVPRAGGSPLVLDMATSATARGRIILAAQTGEDIPEGWAVDTEGRPTTDSQDAIAGSVVPFGGPKGSGLAMMIELLCGGLAAAITGEAIGDMYEDWTREQKVSHFALVLDPDSWVGGDVFRDHVALFATRVAGLPPSDGFDRVFLPGEPEELAREEAERLGVTVQAEVLGDLDVLARELEIELRQGPAATAGVGVDQGGAQ